MNTEVIDPENLVLVPMKVPMQTGMQAAITLFSMVATGVLVGVVVYNWGYTAGAEDKRLAMEKAFDGRFKALEEQFEDRVRAEARKQRDART